MNRKNETELTDFNCLYGESCKNCSYADNPNDYDACCIMISLRTEENPKLRYIVRRDKFQSVMAEAIRAVKESAEWMRQTYGLRPR